MKLFLPFILILSGICTQGCIDCGPQAELSVQIYFADDSLKLDSVYALNAVSQEVIRKQMDNFLPRSHSSISLPISLVSDTTTYVFQADQRIDTLSIYYQRIFRYKGGCGFIADASEPAHADHYHSTFGKTEVHYDSYVLSGTLSWSTERTAPGITIRVEP